MCNIALMSSKLRTSKVRLKSQMHCSSTPEDALQKSRPESSAHAFPHRSAMNLLCI